MLKFDSLKEYHKNPRKISADRFDKLSDSLTSLGDLGGIVVNRRTNEIIGGNQRTKSFLQEKDRFEIHMEHEFKEPQGDGTVGVGYVIKDKGKETEQRFALRVVDWDEEKAERANVQANKVTGIWDYDILANSFDMEKLMEYGFSKQDLDLLPKPPEVKMDNEGLTKAMDSYLEGNIKQIVLYFKAEDFENAVARLDQVMKDTGTESHTDAVLALLDEHEQNE